MTPDVIILIVAVVAAVGVVFLRDAYRSLRNLIQRRRETHCARFVAGLNRH